MNQGSISMKECREYVNNIMPQIIDLLTENSISFTSDASTSEIKIKNSDKKEICSLLRKLAIPHTVLYFILDISQVKDNVYIRKKIK